jgi:hypothetical protein
VDLELDGFKRINLAEYAASRGYRLVAREPMHGGRWRGSTRSSLLLRHPTTNDKVVLRVDRDGHWTYFSVRDDRDNGTIIDFMQRRGARTLAEIRQELRTWSGRRPVPSPERIAAPIAREQHDRTALRQEFARARAASNSHYLNSRGIRPDALSCERFAGTWRADARGDLLFPHRDGPGPDGICGFERKNAQFAGFSAGGTKAIWSSNVNDNDTKLVFTEAVIDAFSYHQVHQDPRARYASTGGSVGERQARHIAAAIAQIAVLGGAVITATDNDEAGERLAARIGVLAGDVAVVRHRSPVGKDWNDYLQRHERDYIRSLGLRGPDIGR